MKSILLLFFFSFFILSCSNITVINKEAPKLQANYSETFMKEITKAKELYKQGKGSEATKILLAMDLKKITTIEDALRLNLTGVILFSATKYDQALKYFEGALLKSESDNVLAAQILLNESSAEYRLGMLDKAHASLVKCNYHNLGKEDAEKRHMLLMEVSKVVNNRVDYVKASILFLSQRKAIADIKGDRSFPLLLNYFFEMGDRDRLRLLEELKEDRPLVVGYLGYLDGERNYNLGRKSEGKEELNWVKDEFHIHNEIVAIIEQFLGRLNSFAKLNSNVIGVVLPLSGDKKGFGERALLGIQTALVEFNNSGADLKVEIRDSAGSSSVGAMQVRTLIDNQSVAAVIGGLFPQTAMKEYFEAKKSGVLFISLSQVYLPREKKDHLLIEIPGSIESQVKELLSERVMNRLGNKGAILYPKSQKGEAYAEEFWRESQARKVAINSAVGYERERTDYRDPVQNLLGLKFTRERSEEQSFLESVYANEKLKNQKRLQVLKPDINYDWVFIPGAPLETMQIIPAFSYFDAPKLKLIGDPSWRSETVAKESNKFDGLYLVGEGTNEKQDSFATQFATMHKVAPRIIEMSAYDATKILGQFIKGYSGSDRNQLDTKIRSESEVSGITGKWTLSEGIWIKQMTFLKLSRGKIEPAL